VPLLHHYWIDSAIETRRPYRTVGGISEPLLLPGEYLILRWLGQWSELVPCVVLMLFALSFWKESLQRFTSICVVALCQCALTTVYALYAVALLRAEWLHPFRLE
jgi:hypothetical protein